MSNGRTLRLHLGLRFGAGPDRQICNRAAEFLEEIERLETKNPIPLYWNFPVAAVLKSEATRLNSPSVKPANMGVAQPDKTPARTIDKAAGTFIRRI